MKPLVDVAELAAALAGERSPRVLDVQWWLGQPGRGRTAHERGHIPGAVHVDVDEVFAGPVSWDGRGGRHPLPSPERLQDGLRQAGISNDQTVVVYDQGSSMGAARAWWVLRDAGLAAVRVLDGGLAAWVEAGQPSESGAVVAEPGTVVVTPGHLDSVDAEGVAAVLAGGGQVFDVRSAERFAGADEPVDPVAGHIPGAQSLPATQLHRAGRFLPTAELAEALSALRGGDVVSCGSGITAAHVVLAAEQVGLGGLRLYPGSWSDWISDPTRPVATGR